METEREWSMIELARLVGATRRTLRHYAEIGLLTPSRVSRKGYRYYGEPELLRLQRVLLLRELGLGLAEIREVLARPPEDAVEALRGHLEGLRAQAERVARQLVAVERTLARLEKGVPLVAEEALDGFDHENYREEIEGRWGPQAYRASNDWWRALSARERSDFQASSRRLAEAWGEARLAERSPDSDEAQALAAQHVAWLQSVPGTPSHGVVLADPELVRYVAGLATMYVDDPRFAQNYDRCAPGTAQLVRDSLLSWCASAA